MTYQHVLGLADFIAVDVDICGLHLRKAVHGLTQHDAGGWEGRSLPLHSGTSFLRKYPIECSPFHPLCGGVPL
jgi:hypothetical protein